MGNVNKIDCCYNTPIEGEKPIWMNTLGSSPIKHETMVEFV